MRRRSHTMRHALSAETMDIRPRAAFRLSSNRRCAGAGDRRLFHGADCLCAPGAVSLGTAASQCGGDRHGVDVHWVDRPQHLPSVPSRHRLERHSSPIGHRLFAGNHWTGRPALGSGLSLSGSRAAFPVAYVSPLGKSRSGISRFVLCFYPRLGAHGTPLGESIRSFGRLPCRVPAGSRGPAQIAATRSARTQPDFVCAFYRQWPGSARLSCRVAHFF